MRVQSRALRTEPSPGSSAGLQLNMNKKKGVDGMIYVKHTWTEVQTLTPYRLQPHDDRRMDAKAEGTYADPKQII